MNLRFTIEDQKGHSRFDTIDNRSFDEINLTNSDICHGIGSKISFIETATQQELICEITSSSFCPMKGGFQFKLKVKRL